MYIAFHLVERNLNDAKSVQSLLAGPELNLICQFGRLKRIFKRIRYMSASE